MAIPQWMQSWLRIPFYEAKCKIHQNEYTTFFCGDCMAEPLCRACWNESKVHQGHHQILRVYTASKRPAIVIKEIKQLWDISEIQEYIINKHHILHLHPKPGEGKANATQDCPPCQTCKRKLKQYSTFTFCSIECKYKSIEAQENIQIQMPNIRNGDDDSTSRSRPSRVIRISMRNLSVVMKRSMRRRRRKQLMPQRAPLK